MMTVGELKKIIENLPDDMLVVSYDVGGYAEYEFVGAEVVTVDEAWGSRYQSPLDRSMKVLFISG